MELKTPIIQALDDMRIVSPTEIQDKCITNMLQSPTAHVVAQSKTGSGKTLAYAIPIMSQIDVNLKQVQALILVPTRELCKQVHKVFISLSKYQKVRTVEVYGGVSIAKQINQIHKGAQVVIATPGRLIDLYNRKQIRFDKCQFVALDEADQMLDMGFIPDIQIILLEAMEKITPRLMLFSATMASKIKKLISDFTQNTNLVDINVSKDSLIVENCHQKYYSVPRRHKYDDFVRILRAEKPEYSIIFTATKDMAEVLNKRLKNEPGLDLSVEFINGDLPQGKREAIMRKFRNKYYNCIVGTNVLARGLDFPRVSHVFNYDIPRRLEDYVHRIGRTARMGGTEKDVTPGVAITLVTQNEKFKLRKIEEFVKTKLEKGHLVIDKNYKPSKRSNDRSDFGRKDSYNSGRRSNDRSDFGRKDSYNSSGRSNDRSDNARDNRDQDNSELKEKYSNLERKFAELEKKFADSAKVNSEQSDSNHGGKKKSYGDKKKSYGDKKKSYGDKKKSYGDKKKKSYGEKAKSVEFYRERSKGVKDGSADKQYKKRPRYNDKKNKDGKKKPNQNNKNFKPNEAFSHYKKDFVKSNKNKSGNKLRDNKSPQWVQNKRKVKKQIV